MLSFLQYLNIDLLIIEEASYEEGSDDIATLRLQKKGWKCFEGGRLKIKMQRD